MLSSILHCKSSKFHKQPKAIQLLEYQTDVWRCRFDTLNSAHRAGAPTACEQWVAPAQWVSPIVCLPLWQVHPPCGSTSNCSCTVGGPATMHCNGEQTIGLTHRAGATHRSRAVGAPARWAGVDFPTGINLAHCSARTLPTRVHC